MRSVLEFRLKLVKWSCVQMNVSAVLTFLFVLTLSVFPQDPPAPVITVRKGVSIVVDVKEITGASGSTVANILKNDVQLSGALALGDANSSTVTVTGIASTGAFSGKVIDKSGSTILQKAYPGEASHAVHEFADSLVETLTGQKGIASSKIGFVADRAGHKEIYTCDYDGKNVLQLTHDNAISVSPALSPDGKKLAYTTEDSQSGYQAPRRFFASFARAAEGSLFSALVGPLFTPRNVARAVLAGDADIGSLDSYAHDLLRRHEPELAAGLRTVATTAPTPVPPLVAAAGTPRETLLRLREALFAVAAAEELADAREALLIEGFTAVDRADYRVLIDAAHEADRLGYPRLA